MKTTLVLGVIVAIVVLVGILAIFLSVGKHSVTTSSNTLPAVSLSSTSTTTTQTSSSTTTNQSTTTTSTIVQQVKLQPDELYFLNYSNGTYWYVGVLNISLPNIVDVQSPVLITGLNVYQEHTYHLYGYTEILLPMKTKLGAGRIIPVYIGTPSSNNTIGIVFFYNGYNWTYGNL